MKRPRRVGRFWAACACSGLLLAGACATDRSARRDTVDLESRSVCSVPLEDEGEIILLLEGISWQGWQAKCVQLVPFLRPGAPPFDGHRAVDIEVLLEETGYFRQAVCEVRAGGSVIECVLSPQAMIREISIRGRLPVGILREDLSRRLFVAPGTLVVDEATLVAQLRERLLNFFEREGIFESEVAIATIPITGAEPNLALRLEVEISVGRGARIREVQVEGDDELEGEVERTLRHFGFLGLFPRRFRPDRFQDDLDELTATLHERGFPEARVTGLWELDPVEELVDVVVRVDSGPRLEILFSGNDSVSDRRLEALATFAEAGIIDPTEVESAAYAIRNLYQERGFADAAVNSEVEQPDPRTIRLTYFIEEGQRSRIRRLVFEGNEEFTDRGIRREAELGTRRSGWISAGRWVEPVVTADEGAIEEIYRLQGYGAAEVEAKRFDRPDGDIEVVFRIEEKGRRMVRSSTIAGLPEEIDDQGLTLRLEMRAGGPFVEEQTERDRNEILATLAAEGYPAAEVVTIVDAPPPDEGGPVDIEHLVAPGVRFEVAGFFVRGNFRTRESLIREQLHLASGEHLDLVTLGEDRRRLRGLGAFTSVEIQPLGVWLEDGESWQMVAVQEQTARTADLVASYATDEGFSIGGDYRDRNLFGRAFHLDLRLRLGDIFGRLHPSLQIGRSDRLDTSLRAPRPFAAPFDVDASVFYRFDDFEAFLDERLGIGAGLSRQILDRDVCRFCPDAMTQLRYEVSAARFELREPVDDDEPAEDLEPRALLGGPLANVGRIVPLLALDRRDSFADPQRGWAADLRLELAHPLLSPLPEGHGFYRALLGGRGYWSLGTPWQRAIGRGRILGGPVVLAVNAGLGLARPIGEGPGLPLSEALYYGGDYSVRGLSSFASAVAFPGANYRAVGSLEARWYVARNIFMGSVQLAAFVDAASVSYRAADLFGSPAVSVGPVLRYITPVGPLSLAWGVAVVRPAEIVDARPDVIPERGRLHLTFGYAF